MKKTKLYVSSHTDGFPEEFWIGLKGYPLEWTDGSYVTEYALWKLSIYDKRSLNSTISLRMRDKYWFARPGVSKYGFTCKRSTIDIHCFNI